MANIIINDNPEFSTEMEAFTPKTFANAEEWNTRFKKVIEAAAFLKSYIDTAYENSNSYTDSEIAELIGGAPELRNTLKELSDAIDGNKTLADLLTEAIGKKASQVELETHTANSSIHVTTTNKTNWDNAATTAQEAQEAVDTLNTNFAKFETDVNNNLEINGTSFIYDYQDGVYGYNTSPERGADTFHPFKSTMGVIKSDVSYLNSGQGTVTFNYTLPKSGDMMLVISSGAGSYNGGNWGVCSQTAQLNGMQLTDSSQLVNNTKIALNNTVINFKGNEGDILVISCKHPTTTNYYWAHSYILFA